MSAAAADHVHIVTEGPLGLIARSIKCRTPFTTSYHTRYPEYLSARLPVPEQVTYAWLRRFHNAAAATLVATPSLAVDLASKGFTKLKPWTRGVDTELFNPRRRGDLGLPAAGLSLCRARRRRKKLARLPRSRSARQQGRGRRRTGARRLRSRYPATHFMGDIGDDLARIYALADVFVFPSRTDTFGTCSSKGWRAACRWQPTPSRGR